MGNHQGPGRDRTAPRPYIARSLAAAGVCALSLWSLNASGSAAGQQSSTAATSSATGMVSSAGGSGARPVPGGLTGAPDAQPSNTPDDAARQPSILTAPPALVPFPRAAVGSYAFAGTALLSVAQGSVDRPPAGYLRAPLERLVPSSPFGFRINPLSGVPGDFHLGQDYAAPCGTEVHASDSGVVRAAGWHPWGGGNRVEVDHGNGLITTYNHLQAIAVRTGAAIQVGQVIASVGSTGWSTGCHLHFETILHGRHVSPLLWKLLPALPFAGHLNGVRDYAPGHGLPSGEKVSWALPAGHGSEPLVDESPAGTWTTTESPALVPQPAPSAPAAPAEPGPPPAAPTAPASAEPQPSAVLTEPLEPAIPDDQAEASPAPIPATPTAPAIPEEPAEPSPAPTVPPAPDEPAPSPTPTPTIPAAPAAPAIGTAPDPTDRQRCLVRTTQETPSLDQYIGPLATNSGYEQLLEDAACDTLASDPTDPERRDRD